MEKGNGGKILDPVLTRTKGIIFRIKSMDSVLLGGNQVIFTLEGTEMMKEMV